MFPSATDQRLQGFVRIINHSDRSGEVEIRATDDGGNRFGPALLSIDAQETVHFNSADLESGNKSKGLPEGVDSGSGDWWLMLQSDLHIEVLSYIRTPADGFLTSMYDLVHQREDGRYRVPIFNPASNSDQVSRLRMINPGAEDAQVTVAGIDGNGASGRGEVRLTVPAGAVRTLNAQQLETGGGFEGALGDGAGKWQLVIESDHPLHVMSLLSSPTGHLTNLSAAPENVVGNAHAVPLFPAASDSLGRQGFVRVINHSNETGEVVIRAFDDSDRGYESLTLELAGGETTHFNSNDLEMGNLHKGLTGSTGAGAGDWRLTLSSGLDIEVLAYIRTTGDGFLTAIHDTVVREGTRHRVATFNPGSNVNQVSMLRLVNAGVDTAEVRIVGIDGTGARSSGEVAFAIPGSMSRTLTAQELESGEGLTGGLGPGNGKWQLVVESELPLTAMSLLASPSGHLTNLSTGPAIPMVRDHNVILRVVRVTTDWMAYASANGGWPAAVDLKESDHLKYFEAAIWEETASVHLYEFDNDFDPQPPGQTGWTDEQKIEHRERYRVLEFSGLPPAYTDERSTYLRSAFESMVEYIVERFPNSDHHLVYSGHGGPGGRLFAALVNRGDAKGFLSHWHQLLGRPLGVIDMGGPCNKAGYRDLETFCPHTGYYIASDLPNGGYTMDEWTIEKHNEVNPDSRYHDLFTRLGSLRSALEVRIDLRRRRYEYSRENMIAGETEQANYLYACRDFASFAGAVEEWPGWDDRLSADTQDVRSFLESNNAPQGILEHFDAVIVHRADNRDFFDWQVVANGMLMPRE